MSTSTESTRKRKTEKSPSSKNKRRKIEIPEDVDTVNINSTGDTQCVVCYKTENQTKFSNHTVSRLNLMRYKSYFKLSTLEEGPLCNACYKAATSKRRYRKIDEIRCGRTRLFQLFRCCICDTWATKDPLHSLEIHKNNRREFCQFFDKKVDSGWICKNCYSQW